MAKAFKYATNCTLLDYRSVDMLYDMVDNAKNVTLSTIRKHCDLDGLLYDLGYSVGNDKGLHIKDDWHVSYYKSKFCGKSCYYIKHSSIEHIFIEG